MIYRLQKFSLKRIVTGAIILLLIIFGAFQYIEKEKYVKYMSFELSNDLGNMNRSILMNDIYLQRVLSSQEITYDEAYLLAHLNGQILRISATYKEMATVFLDRAGYDELPNSFVNSASTIHHYFSVISDSLSEENKTLSLISIQLEQVRAMIELNDRWIKEVESHAKDLNIDRSLEEKLQMFIGGDYFELYNEDNQIKSDSWVELLKDLSTTTDQFMNEEFPDVNNDFEEFLSQKK